MPNLNEFINVEPPIDPKLEKIDGSKPCRECDKDSNHYFWNQESMEISWTCPDGHKNIYRVG